MSTDLARQALAGLHSHGHHSHGHLPNPSHDPPRYANGGWYPAGAGPFRPGPGSPSFGAAMPAQSRPGVVFGARSFVHDRIVETAHERLGTLDHGSNIGAARQALASVGCGVGSSQRWHAVTRLASGQPMVGAVDPSTIKNARVKLTSAQQTALHNAMLAALGGSRTGAPVKAPTGQTVTTHWGNVVVARGDMKAAPLSAAKAIAMAKEMQAAQLKQVAQQALGGWASSSQPGNSPTSPSGAGTSAPGVSASLDVNVPTPSIPQPSASASANLSL